MLLNTPKQKISALFLLFVMATILSYIFLDTQIALWARSHFSDADLHLFSFYTFPLEPLVVPLYILLILKLLEKSSKMVKVFINIGAATLFTITSVTILKFILARPRPSAFINSGMSGINPFHFDSRLISMPSGHGAAAGVISAIIFVIFKNKGRLWLIIPTLLCLFRVLSLNHFLSDVIIGYGIGFCSVLVFHLNDRTIFDKLKDKLWKRGEIA